MRLLTAIAFVFAALPASGEALMPAGTAPAAPPHAALYSFADLYRLAVTGEATSACRGAALDEPAIRVAAGSDAQWREARFTVIQIAQPSPWLLLASGLAAAMWVARRRVGYYL